MSEPVNWLVSLLIFNAIICGGESVALDTVPRLPTSWSSVPPAALPGALSSLQPLWRGGNVLGW